MPRQLRIEYPCAIHHVMSRGDRRENIYLDDVDRQDFLKTLAEACQKTDWQVHAYCLMRNHFHLVVETPNVNLVDGMHWLLKALGKVTARRFVGKARLPKRSELLPRNWRVWVGSKRTWCASARTLQRNWQ